MDRVIWAAKKKWHIKGEAIQKNRSKLTVIIKQIESKDEWIDKKRAKNNCHVTITSK